MISIDEGTMILWIYWPNFNGILSPYPEDRSRIVFNTLLSLCGSVVFAFILSIVVSDESKFSLINIQNATLAGGVAVGAVANLMIKPFGALLIGAVAGTISTLGNSFLTVNSNYRC
jgi:ammonium transporter Rh